MKKVFHMNVYILFFLGNLYVNIVHNLTKSSIIIFFFFFNETKKKVIKGCQLYTNLYLNKKVYFKQLFIEKYLWKKNALIRLKNNKLINRNIWKNSPIADDDRYLFDMNLKKKVIER